MDVAENDSTITVVSHLNAKITMTIPCPQPAGRFPFANLCLLCLLHESSTFKVQQLLR